MNRKVVVAINAPLDQVQEVFCDIAAWHEWMPTIKASKIVEKKPDYILAKIRSVYKGMESDQLMEFSFQPNLCKQRQISGRLKKWEAEWRFYPTPEGSGTTLSISVDLDLGFIGLFTPDQTVARMLDDWSRQIVHKAQERIERLSRQEKPAEAEVPKPEVADDEVLIQVFQTPQGLEVLIRDQKYFIPVSLRG